MEPKTQFSTPIIEVDLSGITKREVFPTVLERSDQQNRIQEDDGEHSIDNLPNYFELTTQTMKGKKYTCTVVTGTPKSKTKKHDQFRKSYRNTFRNKLIDWYQQKSGKNTRCRRALCIAGCNNQQIWTQFCYNFVV